MGHLHFQTYPAAIEDNTIIIDLAALPVGQLTSLARLGEGLSAAPCDEWGSAARAAARGLHQYLGDAAHDIIVGDGFTINVIVVDDPKVLMPYVISFFDRELITVVEDKGVRIRAVGDAALRAAQV